MRTCHLIFLGTVFLGVLGAGCRPAAPAPIAGSSAELHVGGGGEQANIYRDAYGVPHVYAGSLQGMWFGAGYAQAQDRLLQLELTRRNVEGTLAEIFGPSQLPQDEAIRTFYYTPAELQTQFATLPASQQQAIQAFADGINSYVAQAYASASSAQAMVPYEFFVLGQLLGLDGPYRPADWEPIDTVALGVFMARDFGGGGGNELDNQAFLQYLQAEFQKTGAAHPDAQAKAVFNDTLWINDPTAPTTVPGYGERFSDPLDDQGQGLVPIAQAASAAMPGDAVRHAAAVLRSRKALLQKTGEYFKIPWRDGSNAFVVTPSRTRDGHALLWGAPQEGFGTPSVNGEVYLHAPGYDAGGMYIVGEPFVLIGLNKTVAWTTTSEELVDQQIYAETVNFQADPPTYLYQGSYVPMTVLNETIQVAGQAPVDFPVYRTVHGPVFDTDPAHGLAFSMRFASWNVEIGALSGFSEFGADTDLDSFRASTAKITTLHNLFYADQAGTIAYFGAGLVPILPRCPTCDPRLPHAGDGSQEWLGYDPFPSMPHSVNPAQGYLVNWNTKPDRRHYYQQNGGDEYWGTIFRSDRIAQMLAATTDATVATLQDVEHDIGTIDHDDAMRPAAPYFLPFLLSAYERLKQAGDPLTDGKTHPLLAPALQELRGWDMHTALGSPAMYIFVEFMEALERNTFAGGVNSGEAYVGAVNFNDNSLGQGSFFGNATYNLLYHVLAGVRGIVPCDRQCFAGDYFAGQRDRILVESLNDAIALLSGTGPLLGNDGAVGFGKADVNAWGWAPYHNIDWDSLDPLAVGIVTHMGKSPQQQRSTYMQGVELAGQVFGSNVLPPGQSGFISAAGQPAAHFGDQVGLFNQFRYKPMAMDFPGGP